MRRVFLLIVAIILSAPLPAWGDGDGPVSAGDDDFNVSIEHVTPAEVLLGAGGSNSGTTASASTTLTRCDLSKICSSLACEPTPQSPLGGEYVYADGSSPPLNLGWCNVAAPAALPQVTPGLVLAALRRIGLPESELDIQPPNGRTLVNFDTNFYTRNGQFTRSVTLLGRHVELRIWPARYGWRFGDGATRWTTSPGSAYPDLEITHRYLRKGRVSPSVDTTYAAQFRVDGGPWRDVDGTVTIPGTPEALQVVTARPVLVGD